MRPADLTAFNRLLSELTRESDRGLALVGAAFIDEKLGATLEAFCAEDARGLIRGKNAPLGSFSSRIEACFALALIEELERNDCDYIRRVRNEFAHSVSDISFREGKVRDLCQNFRSTLPEPSLEAGKPTRFKFQNAVVAMSTRLFYRPEWVARERRARKVWVDAESMRWRRSSEELPPEGEPVIGVNFPVSSKGGR